MTAPSQDRTEMPPAYDPRAVEQRLYELWESGGYFQASTDPGKPAFTIIMPPPNVTGELHLGHALTAAIEDALIRWHRMLGDNTLWLPGTDHAGIATQMVVERQLMQRGEPDRRQLGRAKFLEKVWAWKAESGGTIINQLKRLGCSCDWSRERFTMDEGLSRAVLKVFVELYREGLIYKDKRLVNWDPKLLTAISDLEVQQVEVNGHLWYLKYPIEGSEDTHIVVATTRPETMLGDAAVAVHPRDERYRHLIGRHAILPLVGRRLPIIADEYSDPEKGTGAVKVTPAHDFNDFEVGRRHGLPQINVFDIEARLDLKDNEAFLAGVPRSAELDETLAMHGLDRFVARKRIVERLEARGLLARIEAHKIELLVLVPTILHRLLEAGAPSHGNHLRAVISGSAPLSPSLVLRTLALLGQKLYNLYGSSETGVISLASPKDLLEAPGTVGHPLPGVTLKILDEAKNELPRGQIGQVWVSRGGQIAPTGDLGYLDPQGRLFLAGRADEVLICGGEKVFPTQIEERITNLLPYAEECAVVGVPDLEYGQALHLFLVLKPSHLDMEIHTIQRDLEEHLPRTLRPRYITLLAELPRNQAGKLLRAKLRALLETMSH
ncbi:MAG: class I tRNA ligase family protein [Meiothermus silvanus]|nr:class I tRNA ligase family protein [Allomeiothermus silvanus]